MSESADEEWKQSIGSSEKMGGISWFAPFWVRLFAPFLWAENEMPRFAYFSLNVGHV